MRRRSKRTFPPFCDQEKRRFFWGEATSLMTPLYLLLLVMFPPSPPQLALINVTTTSSLIGRDKEDENTQERKQHFSSSRQSNKREKNFANGAAAPMALLGTSKYILGDCVTMWVNDVSLKWQRIMSYSRLDLNAAGKKRVFHMAK